MLKDDSRIRLLDYTDPRGYSYAEVDIDLLVPDPQNPRIPIQESARDTILALVERDSEGLYQLAKDLVAVNGSNPGELPNVTPVNDQYFLVKEGNRRIAARKLLLNPEILRDVIPPTDLKKWIRLSQSEKAHSLSHTVLVVIGEDHENWVDRRHLGLQSGVGIVPWGPQEKARRDEQRKGIKDRSLALLDSLKETYPDRFDSIQPPQRTFTVFSRVLESPEARALIGVDVDSDGHIVLNHGERSLQLIEQVLLSLRKSGDEKLTSRKINSPEQTVKYLERLNEDIPENISNDPVTLSGSLGKQAKNESQDAKKNERVKDVLRTINVPQEARLKKIHSELLKIKRGKAPNAAMVLTRVFLELYVDCYTNVNSLSFAGDRNPDVEKIFSDFINEVKQSGIKIPKIVGQNLKFGASKPLSLAEKLKCVVEDLIKKKLMTGREGQAKIRELQASDILPLLNDSVHRLENSPSIERVDHVLEVIRPILNAMFKAL